MFQLTEHFCFISSHRCHHIIVGAVLQSGSRERPCTLQLNCSCNFYKYIKHFVKIHLAIWTNTFHHIIGAVLQLRGLAVELQLFCNVGSVHRGGATGIFFCCLHRLSRSAHSEEKRNIEENKIICSCFATLAELTHRTMVLVNFLLLVALTLSFALLLHTVNRRESFAAVLQRWLS